MKRRSGLLTAILCLAVAPTSFADLTPAQQQFARTVQQRLDQAVTNLKAAQDAAGPETTAPTGSRANLALSRSASARAQLTTVQDALKKLPADDATAKKMTDQAAKVDADINALEKRLTGTDAPAPAAATGGVKLDYQQQKLLKDLQSYLAEVEGYAGGIEKVVDEVKAAKDLDLLDHQRLADAEATLEKARGRKKYMDDYLSKLPADGVDVPAARKGVDTVAARLDAAAAVLDPVHARLQKLINPGSYPALDADVTRLRQLASMFADPAILESNPPRAAEVYAQGPAAAEELARVLKLYALFVRQKVDAARPLEAAAQFLQEKLGAYVKAAGKRGETLPAEIKADLAKAAAVADQAVAEKKPLFFTGGVPQQMKMAEAKLSLLAAIDPVRAAESQKALADTRAQLARKQAGLRELIIAENPLPPDRYAGGDKARLGDAAAAAWKKVQPDARVLVVRIPSEKWERETLWRRQNNSWYLIDRSKLQAQVVVQSDDKVAVIRPVDLWIDHVDNDKFSAIPMFALKDDVQPDMYLTLDKAKGR